MALSAGLSQVDQSLPECEKDYALIEIGAHVKLTISFIFFSVLTVDKYDYFFLFPDLAVGSPYAAGGTGAVYIFHGGRNGVVQTWSQVVYASELDTGLRGFGFSIKGRTDLDGNQYPGIRVKQW